MVFVCAHVRTVYVCGVDAPVAWVWKPVHMCGARRRHLVSCAIPFYLIPFEAASLNEHGARLRDSMA